MGNTASSNEYGEDVHGYVLTGTLSEQASAYLQEYLQKQKQECTGDLADIPYVYNLILLLEKSSTTCGLKDFAKDLTLFLAIEKVERGHLESEASIWENLVSLPAPETERQAEALAKVALCAALKGAELGPVALREAPGVQQAAEALVLFRMACSDEAGPNVVLRTVVEAAERGELPASLVGLLRGGAEVGRERAAQAVRCLCRIGNPLRAIFLRLDGLAALVDVIEHGVAKSKQAAVMALYEMTYFDDRPPSLMLHLSQVLLELALPALAQQLLGASTRDDTDDMLEALLGLMELCAIQEYGGRATLKVLGGDLEVIGTVLESRGRRESVREQAMALLQRLWPLRVKSRVEAADSLLLLPSMGIRELQEVAERIRHADKDRRPPTFA
ncbi:hypothetical protein CYMTET_31077, partial [Cymbomonas tetramitiformis]